MEGTLKWKFTTNFECSPNYCQNVLSNLHVYITIIMGSRISMGNSNGLGINLSLNVPHDFRIIGRLQRYWMMNWCGIWNAFGHHKNAKYGMREPFSKIRLKKRWRRTR